MELRQLRYFVTLAEELHFGRAAAREHIVQSALSQQIQRLERELRVPLVERSTHHVRLTAAGVLLLAEARLILSHVDRAAAAARTMTGTDAIARVALGDASFDTMPMVLAAVRHHHPRLVEVHQIEAGVPEQCRMLAQGHLDVGIGRATQLPAGVASEVIRLDRLGVLVGAEHPWAQRHTVPLTELAGETQVFADESRAPEFNEYVRELCRTAGFVAREYPGTVHSVLGAGRLVRDGHAVACVPRSCAPLPGLRWLPLAEPAHYPWSLLWRANGETEAVRAIRCCARLLAERLGWTSRREPEAAIVSVAERRAG
ncbi:LysR family transcriptional regulator [Nocardia sp. NPDC059240]|uniref:LysR family transcriptional regulator n=1 Tax=Nocardia sp. NPDC059240 TaxID=3346786 RepID=UPI00367BDF72